MGKYFGTDGFRGEANVNLTADHAFQVGRFLGWYYSELKQRQGSSETAKVVIGKDTRRSSYMFEYALAAGLTASGADAYLLHVTTTPSVAYVTRMDDFDCGVMISASHNPYFDNGIKLINCHGEKMEDTTIELVEQYLDGKLNLFGQDWPTLPYAKQDAIGRTVDYVAGRNRYIGYLISLGMYSFKGMKVGLDCANGAAWNIGRLVFEALGAKTYVINNDPDGREGMALGQFVTGMAFSNVGLGIAHSIAHTLGAVYDTPHGVACAMMLPIVMEFNADQTGEKLKAVAEAMGVDTTGMTQEEYRKAAVDAVRQLSIDVGIPTKLAALKEEDLDFLAESAYADACAPGNPKAASVEDMKALIRKLM